MNSLARSIAAALILLTPFAARADVEAGVEAFRKANFPAALKELEPAAQNGNAVAHYFLGKMHGAGLGVPKDAAKATAHFKTAAEGGLTYAQVELANALVLGDGIESDLVEAMKWLFIAADAGLGEGRDNLNQIGKNVDRRTLLEARVRARQWQAENKTISPGDAESLLAAPPEMPGAPARN